MYVVTLPDVSPVGVVGYEERLEDDLGQDLTRLVTEPVNILSDPLVAIGTTHVQTCMNKTFGGMCTVVQI